MLSAQEARNLVAAKEEVATAITSLETKITASATAGLLFLDEPEIEEILAVQLMGILIDLGYAVTYESARQTLKIKW